jgi:hypothetical protein
MYSMTNNKRIATLRAVLFTSFVASASAWAGEATLAQNEHAAQNTIVATGQSRPTANDDSAATLARNEDAAQRVIVNGSASIPERTYVAKGAVALSQNEIAAQRAISDAPVSEIVKMGRISASFGATSGGSAASP